jgi:hypothetical protein
VIRAYLFALGLATIAAELTRTIPLPPGVTITVESTVGDVEIRGWERDELAVSIEAPDAVVPRVDEAPSSIVISAVQPGGGMDRGLRTRIILRAPPRTVFESIRMLDGRLKIDGLSGSVTADVRQGEIHATRVGGRLRLETGFGDVKVEDATLDPDGLLRLRAFNGDVHLALARRPADARILALSFNGRIDSAIPLQRREQFGPRFGEATLGKGEPVISIDVVNGNIYLR